MRIVHGQGQKRELASLRSSRFLSFSKRSRTVGKLRNFFLAHPRRAPSLARFSLACLISARPEKGKESAATQARENKNLQQRTLSGFITIPLYVHNHQNWFLQITKSRRFRALKSVTNHGMTRDCYVRHSGYIFSMMPNRPVTYRSVGIPDENGTTFSD